MKKEVYNDRRLSWASKGILVYLLTRPEGWVLHVYDLKNKTNKGVKSIRSVLRELSKYGYIKLKTIQDDNNKFCDTGYVLGDWYYEYLQYHKPYINGYASVEWQKKRLTILERDEWKCTECGRDNGLMHVHHLRYINDKPLWEVDDKDLITLCNKCHRKKHTK